LIAPEIQRDIVHCFAKEVLQSILEEIGDDIFCLLVDEFNGLQSLIMRENSSAYYVHCFAHQLQLVLVAIARKHK
jgi:hypothetical protein